ncbi:MAG: alkylation response protein AidB-like acyl-CoA dehydrogenase [Bacteroidia bacterium]|jgi:alkylation response protein AidB-like acyl-CoA dehydrogenase
MSVLTEEQSLIREQASAWALNKAPVSSFRALRDSDSGNGHAPQTWQAMVDMGWSGILISEQHGGSDLGYRTFGLILEQLGSQLTASPLFASSLVGASALLLGGSPAQCEAVLPQIVDGSAILTLAVDESPHHAPQQTAMTATKAEDGFKLSGKKTFVPEGLSATHFIVPARTAGAVGEAQGISIFLVPASAAGLARTALPTIDSRDYARLEFNEVTVDETALLGELDAGMVILEPLLDRARAGMSAEMLGTASQAFDMTLEYLKTREQFGKVIGSFQALGHRAATLFSAKEQARSCVEAALQAIDADDDNVPELVSLAKCRVGQFLYDMSNELIQIHGGIGMTDEFDAGLYLKRARTLETSYGNRAFHRDRYATLLGF